MDVTARNSKIRPALEEAISRLRRCDDALLRHLARQIERDELSPTTALQMLERFEAATLGQLASLRKGSPSARASAADGTTSALKRRIEILGDVLRRIDGPAPTLHSSDIRPRKLASDTQKHPRRSRSAV